jgi:uncharacterized protein YndB with AHSA1/START domain
MEQNNFNKVEASKQFAVPVEQLFRAWNDPEQLKHWWKPMGNNLLEVTNDLKAGGTVRYTFEEQGLTISGTYDEVKENEKLVYSWVWEFPDNTLNNAAYKLTVHFSTTENGSEIRVLQEKIEDKETVHPNEEGWEKGLSDLEQYVKQGTSEPGEQQNQPQLQSGYNESPEQQKVGGV